MFSSAAHDLAVENKLGTTVLREHANGIYLPGIQERTYWVLPGFLVGQGLWYKVFPSTIFWTRVFTITWLPMLFSGVFFYLSKLFPDSREAPWLALLLLAGNFIIIDNAGFARPEIPCGALGIAAMAAYVQWRDRHFYRALFAANFLVALSGLMHPNGIFHWIGLVMLILWLDRRRVRTAAVAVSLMPYCVLGALWLPYLLLDPEGARLQMEANSAGRFIGSFNPLVILGDELFRYAQAYGLATGGINRLKLLQLILSGAAVIGCLLIDGLRRRPMVQLLLAQTGLYFLALTLFNQKLTYYLVHIVPFYVMLTAVWLGWLWENRPAFRKLIPVAVATVVLIDMGGILVKSYTRSYVATQRQTVAFILAQARPSDKIFGTASLLYEMNFDPRLTDDFTLGVDSDEMPDIVVIEQLYRQVYGQWRIAKPSEMNRITDRLSSYTLEFQRDDYEVWIRKDR